MHAINQSQQHLTKHVLFDHCEMHNAEAILPGRYSHYFILRDATYQCYWLSANANANTWQQASGASRDGYAVPNVLFMAGIFCAHDGHLNVLPGQGILQRDLLHRLLLFQSPPVGGATPCL